MYKNSDIEFEHLLERAEHWLATNRPDYYAGLQPSATEAQLDAVENQFSLKLPVAFRLLYRWHNGQKSTCYASLQDIYMFSSLDELTSSKALMDDMIGTDFEDPKWWRRTWIPFLHNGAGDHLCLDLAAEDGGDPGQILIFYHDWDRRPIEFPSLEKWLKNFVKIMYEGKLRF